MPTQPCTCHITLKASVWLTCIVHVHMQPCICVSQCRGAFEDERVLPHHQSEEMRKRAPHRFWRPFSCWNHSYAFVGEVPWASLPMAELSSTQLQTLFSIQVFNNKLGCVMESLTCPRVTYPKNGTAISHCTISTLCARWAQRAGQGRCN